MASEAAIISSKEAYRMLPHLLFRASALTQPTCSGEAGRGREAAWRGGSETRMLAPMARPQEATMLPTLPQPMMPRVWVEGSKPRRSRDDQTYWATAGALHPGALATSMPLSRHQGMSIWSVPIVAVAIIFTDEPERRVELHCVRVRITRASASFTFWGVNAN